MLVKKIKEAAYLTGEFTTRSGKKTDYYIDKYRFETRPEILEPLVSQLAELMPPAESYDRIAAPELGAVPLAAVLSIKVGKPFIIVKKKPKDYGTENLLEGEYKENERVVVIEDVLTTGGAVIRACEVLTDCNLNIVQIVGVINREEGAFENINEKGFKVKALFTTSDLKNC